MEEVDSIILYFLRQLNISVPVEIKSICDLSVNTIIEAVSKCLNTINPSIEVPTKLPPGISHRIEVAAQIASACKDLGCKSNVGYQTFLYYNEDELRQVFMFLIERLPTEGKHANTKAKSTKHKSLLMQSISMKIAEDLNAVWVPPCCGTTYINNVGDFVLGGNNTQIHLQDSILKNAEIVEKLRIKYIQKANLMETNKNSEETIDISSPTSDHKVNIERSLKELKETAIVLKQKLDILESARNVKDIEYSETQKACDKVEADLKNVQNILKSIGVSEVEASENVLEDVQKNIAILHRSSEELTSKNLSLKIDIDKVKNKLALGESERMKCKKILKVLKETAKTLKDEYEKKEEIKLQLKDSYDKMRGGSKRFIYTKRIMEIISNVDKQNLEIQKILEDTRQLQKEINTLEGQLDRCFSITDETLFKDAKKDDQAKKAYKLLALLHSECNTIVSLVNDTGTIARDIVDLEDNIKAETAKRTEDTLRRIQADLSMIEAEDFSHKHITHAQVN